MATRFGTQTPHSHLARARPIGRVGTAHDAAPVVMGTGIVALAMSLAGDDTLSWAWLALAVIARVLLAASTINSLLHDRAALRGRSRSPAALANVAATAVVGSVLLVHGSRVTAICMLAVAAGIEVGLLPVVLHAGRLPREGSSFLLTVAPQSLAALGAALAETLLATWLAAAAAATWAIGIVLYALVLARFDFRELLSGRGDQWVSGGGLAISALALSEITLAAGRIPELHGAVPVLERICVVVWGASLAWLVPLVISEFIAPRLHYHPRRWATVFPVGMYAAASFQVARVAGSDPIRSFALLWTWIALAVWATVFVGLVRCASGRMSGPSTRRRRFND